MDGLAAYVAVDCMMTSSNGNIFHITGPLCEEFTGPGEFHTQRPVTWSFDVFFDSRVNKRLSEQPWGWWFETRSWSLWRHCNGTDIRREPSLLQTMDPDNKVHGVNKGPIWWAPCWPHEPCFQGNLYIPWNILVSLYFGYISRLGSSTSSRMRHVSAALEQSYVVYNAM